MFSHVNMRTNTYVTVSLRGIRLDERNKAISIMLNTEWETKKVLGTVTIRMWSLDLHLWTFILWIEREEDRDQRKRGKAEWPGAVRLIMRVECWKCGFQVGGRTSWADAWNSKPDRADFKEEWGHRREQMEIFFHFFYLRPPLFSKQDKTVFLFYCMDWLWEQSCLGYA